MSFEAMKCSRPVSGRLVQRAGNTRFSKSLECLYLCQAVDRD
jgi:hypothetical protein